MRYSKTLLRLLGLLCALSLAALACGSPATDAPDTSGGNTATDAPDTGDGSNNATDAPDTGDGSNNATDAPDTGDGSQPTDAPDTGDDVDSNYAGIEGAGQLLGAAPEGFVALEVSDRSMRVDDTGFLIIPGLVKNTTADWVRALNVHILIYAADGKLLREEVTFYAMLDVLPPGGASAFRLTRDLNKLTGTPDRFEIEAFGIPTDDPGWQVTVTQVEAKADAGDVAVSGEFRNSGQAECGEPKVAVAVFDGDTLVEAAMLYVGDGSLAAGASVTFDDFVYGVNAVDLRVTVTGDCGNN